MDQIWYRSGPGVLYGLFGLDPMTTTYRWLGRSDLLNEYIAHIGGGLWACPPGVSGPGDWFGKAFFA